MTVTVEIDTKWVKFIRSPFYGAVAALAGVSISFAPLFLYWTGQGKFAGYEKVMVPLCFATIYVVPFVYIHLGTKVASRIRAIATGSES